MKHQFFRRQPAEFNIRPRYSADVVIPNHTSNKSMIRTTENVIVIGALTKGTEVIRHLLKELPIDCPGIVIVQHMPEQLTLCQVFITNIIIFKTWNTKNSSLWKIMMIVLG